MLKITQLSKITALFIGLLFGANAYAQIGIGTITPVGGSILDVTSADKGILVPRVNIINLATIAPVTGGAPDGLLVWNTSAATGIGYHYWSIAGNRWVPLIPATAITNDWSILGNNNIVNGTNFLGTTTSRNLDFRTNNLERMRVQANGQVSINYLAANAPATDQFASTGNYPINGYTTGGWGVSGDATLGYGVVGNATTGRGVVGQSNFGIGTLGASGSSVGVQGQSATNIGVYGFGAIYGVGGQVTNATGIGAFGNATNNGIGVQGQSRTGDGVLGFSGGAGDGVYGQSERGNGVFGLTISAADAVHAEQGGSGRAVNAINYGTGAGVRAESFFSDSYSVHAVDGAASVYADNRVARNDAIIADTNDPLSNSLWARNTDILGTTILAGSGGLNVYPGATGTGIAGSGRRLGVFGYAGDGYAIPANTGNAAGQFTLDSDRNPATNALNNGTRASAIIAGFDSVTPDGIQANQNSYFGGYFAGGNHNNGIPSYAYAGMRYNANANGIAGTDYKIIGNGTNSTIIRDKSNTPRILFSAEAPEILFEDYGTGKLVNGIAQIKIDPILKDAIYVDEKHPLKVFIQLEGECNGVFVTNKSADGFTVKELAGGTSNISFSYHLVANRADEIGPNGEIASKHVGLRFPVGPGPLKEPELAVRKEGDIKAGKETSSKVRPERKVKTMFKVDETIKEAEVEKKETEVVKHENEKVLDNEETKEDIGEITKKVKVSSKSE